MMLAEVPTDLVFRLARIGGIAVGAFVLSRIARFAIRRFERRLSGERTEIPTPEQKRARTLGGTLRATAGILIWFTAVIMVLDQSGVRVGPLIAAAGIGGVALGFGAQNLVRDVISGFFVLLENHYDVGDVVSVAGVSGRVEGVNLRTTILRDLEGGRHVIPNGEVRVSTNLTKDFSRYVMVLPVPYEADLDRAIQVARDAADRMREDEEYSPLMTQPIEILGVDGYGESSVDVKLYQETVPGQQWIVGRELRRRIKEAFDAAGISIPYPHREVIVRNEPGLPTA